MGRGSSAGIPSVGRAIELGNQLANSRVNRAVSREQFQGAKDRNVLNALRLKEYPEERSHLLKTRKEADEDREQTLRNRKRTLALEKYKTAQAWVGNATLASYPAVRERLKATYPDVPGEILPDPSAFPDEKTFAEYRDRFSGYTQKLIEKTAATLLAEKGKSDRLTKTEAGKDKRLGVTETGKDKRLGVTETGKDKRLGVTETGKDKRLGVTEAGKDRRFGALTPHKKRQRITAILRGIATLEKTGTADPAMQLVAAKWGVQLKPGSTIDPEAKAAYIQAANDEIAALSGELAAAPAPSPAPAARPPTAINPKTGERVQFINGNWEPIK